MVAYISISLGLALSVNEKGVFIALAPLFTVFYINSAAWMMLAANLEKHDQGAKSKNQLTTVTIPGAIIEGGKSFFSING